MITLPFPLSLLFVLTREHIYIMKYTYILKLLQELETWWLTLGEVLDLNSRMAGYIRH